VEVDLQETLFAYSRKYDTGKMKVSVSAAEVEPETELHIHSLQKITS